MLDVIIIGAGPAGLFAARELCKKNFKVSIIDAGLDLKNKTCLIEHDLECKPCNHVCSIMGGFGGAQFFEGTKLSIYPAGTGLVPFYGSVEDTEASYELVDRILEDFSKPPRPVVDFSKVNDLNQRFKEVGLDMKYYNAQKVSKRTMNNIAFRIKDFLEQAGVNILLKERVVSVDKNEDGTFKVNTTKQSYLTRKIIFATGRLGSRFLARIANDLGISYDNEEQEIEIGVRVEMPAEVFNEVNNIHNDLKLKKVLDDGSELRTFCQDYKGYITKCVYNLEGDSVISTLDGHIIGVDEIDDGDKKSRVVNLAVHHRFKTDKSIDEIYEMINKMNFRNKPVVQSLSNFMNSTDKVNNFKDELSMKDVFEANINELLPENTLKVLKEFIKEIDKVIPGFANDTNAVYAPSFELGWKKFNLGKDFQTNVPGIYIIGDVTGHFRGAMQAMSSGILCATKVIKSCKKELKYATTNAEKLLVAERAIGERLEITSISTAGIFEIQSNYIQEIALNKAMQLSKIIEGPFVVSDSGLFIDALKGFPGPYSNYVEYILNVDSILKMLKGKENRQARYKEALCYCDGNGGFQQYYAETLGSISIEKSGDFGYGFDKIFIPESRNTTVANIQDDKDRAGVYNINHWIDLLKDIQEE